MNLQAEAAIRNAFARVVGGAAAGAVSREHFVAVLLQCGVEMTKREAGIVAVRAAELGSLSAAARGCAGLTGSVRHRT